MAPAKILVIKLRALGDTVLMTAPLLELAQAFPQAQIHVLVTTAWAPLLEGVPGIARVWTYERHREPIARARALARLAFQIQKEKFDWAVNLHASPSSATLAWASRAKVRSIHFHGHRDKNRHSTVVIPGKGMVKPIIERDMDTVRALGLHVPAGRMPRLFPDAGELQDADSILNGLDLKGPVLGLNLGASRPTKSWPIERFSSLALEWCVKTQGSVLGLAGPHEEPLIQEFLRVVDDTLGQPSYPSSQRADLRSRIQATHTLSLRRLTAVLSRISVLAGNDSGPKHMAIAVDTPTVTLFGPENPYEWHPYPESRHPYLFVDPLPCRKDADPGMPSWCALNVCTVEQHRCMRMIGVDAVLNACLRVAKKERQVSK